MNEKEKCIIAYFLAHPDSYIKDVAEATGISRSSVQRCLQKYSDLSIGSSDNNLTIGQQLRANQYRGKVQGGRTSFLHNRHIQDEHGHFQGSVRDVDLKREDKKREDIRIICTYYLANKSFTLSEIADSLGELYDYSRDYVYDCLLDSRVSSVIGEDQAAQVEQTLEANRSDFYKKLGDIDLNDEILDAAGLSDKGRAVITERKESPNMTLTSIANRYGVSRAAVAKLEDKAFAKIQEVIGRSKNG